MTPPEQLVFQEMSVFADIGAGPPTLTQHGTCFTIGLVRQGTGILLKFDKLSEAVIEIDGESTEIKHASYRALLASERFANLRGWAGAQYRALRESIDESKMIAVVGTLSVGPDTRNGADLRQIEAFLTEAHSHVMSVRVLLIDGPAGVGKTRLIELLALRRSLSFAEYQKPLILHVKSRGRVLTYLQDLIAFSLQTIRVQVTYDQVPILARHGLVQIAIDGFDELGDPNGYDNAWAQVRELTQDIEGCGTLILAGRETFIGRERLLKAVPRLNENRNTVGVVSIQPVAPTVARKWLEQRGWGEAEFKNAEDWGLFDQGSYALRPFFLAQLADAVRDESGDRSRPPLELLVDKMIAREVSKFGYQVETILDEVARTKFVFDVLAETARDIADNQTASIDEEAILWIVDAVLGDSFDPEVSRILKNRILVLAFLQNDDHKGRRCFAHSEFYNYFLSHAALAAVCRPEIPKFLRRTILGADFLINFGTVLETKARDSVVAFLKSSMMLLMTTTNLDRGGRNIGALLLAALPVAGEVENFKISHVDIDDAVVRGSAQSAQIANVTINQLDLREADVSAVQFDTVTIGTLIVDDTTRVSPSFPIVSWIQIVDDVRERTVLDGEALKWLDAHGKRAPTSDDASPPNIPDRVRDQELFVLAQRACRVMLRQHWIRSEGEDWATAIVKDELWNELAAILREHGLLEETERKPVSGHASKFYHVKHARAILAENKEQPEVKAFLDCLVARLE